MPLIAGDGEDGAKKIGQRSFLEQSHLSRKSLSFLVFDKRQQGDIRQRQEHRIVPGSLLVIHSVFSNEKEVE